ncbi:hypothetical protein SAMN05518800_1219 [Variovorax sp. YR752]|uniref:hypothetical protein n=1 Tax=Variovorax sp. YR752 TaxID=1884383 RepID=UPI000BC4A95D|nr:hypothetical protein [Variovorax sp. YR752]SOD24092.1 hypothetical protein SAMN05518800_1219 [Variovorax sp. YR752]
MSISWGNWDVRIYAADAWVSLAPRFSADHPVILDRLESTLDDPFAAVRLQFAQNLHVISGADIERMWRLAQRIAATECNPEIIATYLLHSMPRFARSSPERCEAVLTTVKSRLAGELRGEDGGRSSLEEALGDWIASLFVGQGRPLARAWLVECAADPHLYEAVLSRFVQCLRGHFFDRYATVDGVEDCAICDRAQEGLGLVLAQASATAADAYSVLGADVDDVAKSAARERYRATAMLINNAMNQLYFGSGAHAAQMAAQNTQNAERPGLQDANAMARFLEDYAEILASLGGSREPSTLHHLIELYEFLIPGNPTAVFEAFHAILLGSGREEGYHFESLGNSAVVRIVKRYIADHRGIFEDEGRRARLIAILRLFSEVGWLDALRLLYDLPELLR